MDRAGRKQLLSGSFLAMGAFMVLLAASMTVPALAPLSGTIALVGTLGYILAFALGCGPVPALLSSEIFPTAVRGAGMSLCLLTHWVANFCIGQFFLVAVESVGLPSVYLFFAAVCAAGALFVRGPSVPETKGASLDEIQALMA